MKEAIIISAFSGTGKKYFMDNTNLRVLFINPDDYAYISLQKKNPEFPNNFISHIRDNVNAYDVILFPSSRLVHESLINKGIQYNLIYPNINLRNEYQKRLESKGYDDYFIERFLDTWEGDILNCSLQMYPNKIRLCCEDYYLSDAIDKLIKEDVSLDLAKDKEECITDSLEYVSLIHSMTYTGVEYIGNRIRYAFKISGYIKTFIAEVEEADIKDVNPALVLNNIKHNLAVKILKDGVDNLD